jgi:Carboxypeptidase regulatory-like domain
MVHLERALLACFALLLMAIPSLAQIDRAVLEGTVTDTSGGAISGAQVHVAAIDTGIVYDRKTNSTGYYRVPGLAPGEYTVTVSNPSFKTKAVDHVILQVGETHTLDIPLDVGAIEERVEINAELGPAERSSAEAATVIRTDQIANLPVNGRDWSGLTLLAPFAQDDGGGDQRTIRFAGRARDDNNFNIDGVDAGGIQEQAQKSQTRLQISEDAVAEYRVDSALYDAEYGTQAGGQINVVTKSGSNDFHGTAFGYLRNSVFDARNFNDIDINGNPAIPPFRLGQYGMTLGGPIVKNKTFFFLNYEGLRQFQSSTTQAIVPSASIEQQTLATSPQMCSILQAYPWRASTGSIVGCSPKFVFPDGSFSNAGQPPRFRQVHTRRSGHRP